ncbi:Replicase polyprotein 1a [Temnothorax longispinosus]|uniref:Replicase polyprotein 1a n=1 Tax=Temnothorax longispinosus TaxID=300112 RepID=A0A4S2KJT1_9HYME|nr:Replicase polyprotein 1a [Temnothorax longispinosus]
MRLSTIFELLLILLLVAFAAYGRVIDRDEATHRVARAANNVKQSDIDLTTMSLKQATDSVNRYCTCNENICNCCRDFHIPLVQLKGPGCASLQYLQGDNLAVQLSFGDNILTSTIVNGKSPKPVCVPLPGGFNKFCGRIYSIQRDAKNHFKACLGLELQSPTELEATLRVSCFRFGPEGLKLRPAEPLPVVETEVTSEEDDDDDFFGLGSDDDDDDDDDEDDERPITNTVPDASGVDNAQESDDDDDDDILGFSALLDIFTGGDDDAPTRPQVTTGPPLLEFTIPILPRPTTPVLLEDHELPTFPNNNEQENNYEEHDDITQEPLKAEGGGEEEEENTGALTEESNTEDNTDENQEQITESSNKIVYTAKPDKTPTVNKVKKGVIGNKKKPTHATNVTKFNSVFYDPNTRLGLKGALERIGRDPFPAIGFRGVKCNCEGFTCGCCSGINITLFNLDRRTCTNFTYSPEDFAIKFNLIVNEREVLSTGSLSAKNPPPVCVPFYPPFMSFCVRFFDVYTSGKNLHACIDLETLVVTWPVLILHFDCVKIGADGVSWMKPENGSNVSNTAPLAMLMSEVNGPEIYDPVDFEPDSVELPNNQTSILTPEQENNIGQLKL